ncbi:MAG: hybrid sensor histidine kinase/response regulator [Steroidobacteraceae bacterium]
MSAVAPERVKCLLVDDLHENLIALSALFEDADVELLTASSGAEALELLLVHEFALALLDVHMPEIDGFELAELMRGSERTRQVPIIFVTAGARDLRRTFKGYEAGAVDFLHKPIEPHILRSKADVFFQLYRQKRQLAQQLHDRTETLRWNEMFTAVLGHDLRNPLSAILTSAQVLQRVSQEQTVRDTAARMLSSGRHMNRLIGDMLDLARTRLGNGIPLQREPTDLGMLVQRVLSEHQAVFAQRRIDVLAVGNLTGNWDVERFAQAASNLIGNSLKHGAESRAIDVCLDGNDEQFVVLRVVNGGAIAPELLPHLFDPFRRGQREAGRTDGLGLGLYIVQQIVKAHRGSIEVRTEGDTTEFKVTLPRA